MGTTILEAHVFFKNVLQSQIGRGGSLMTSKVWFSLEMFKKDTNLSLTHILKVPEG